MANGHGMPWQRFFHTLHTFPQCWIGDPFLIFIITFLCAQLEWATRAKNESLCDSNCVWILECVQLGLFIAVIGTHSHFCEQLDAC